MGHTLKNALRWIAVLPSALLAMVLMRLLASIFWGVVDDEVAQVIEETDGFGDHYILGPVYLVKRQILMMLAFVIAGYWVAPSHKNAVRKILAALLALFIIGSTATIVWLWATNGWEVPTEVMVRNAVWLVASGVGIFWAFTEDLAES